MKTASVEMTKYLSKHNCDRLPRSYLTVQLPILESCRFLLIKSSAV